MPLIVTLLTSAVFASGEIAFMRGGDVRILDLQTASERTLFKAGYDRPLVWSPDGRFLIAWKHSDIGWDFWRLDAESEDDPDPVNLTNVQSGGCRSVSFSPDGMRIAFMRDDPPGLWIMSAGGSEMERLTEVGHRDAAPQWSPDGTKLLYVELVSEGRSVRSRVHLLDLATREDRVVAHGASPQWVGPHRLLFTAPRDGGIVAIIRGVDGSKERRVSDPAHDAWSVAVSPDRTRAAYLARSKDGEVALVVASLGPDDDAEKPRTLLRARGLSRLPAWSPDGALIAVSSADVGEPGLWIVSADLGESRKIGEAPFHWPVWRPRADSERARDEPAGAPK